MTLSDGYRGLLDETLAELAAARALERVWDRDATLWKSAPARAAHIANRLGWLDAPTTAAPPIERFDAFAASLREEGFRRVLLLGMGGSSLCPEVSRHTFGVRADRLDLSVLDNTSPAAVRDAEKAGDLHRTFFLVSTKSGTTTETLSFFKHFLDRVKTVSGSPGRRFAAITDPGSALEKIARTAGFREVFLAPPDVGGRYSALTSFGMLPAVMIGADGRKIIERAAAMARACGPAAGGSSADAYRGNPGVALGAALGGLARKGRDKATFVLSSPIASFGSWVEQLVAESTGKEGRGILPVDGEPLAPPAAYGADRVFVSLRVGNEPEPEGLAALESAGHPVIRLALADRYDLGAEYFRWEMATAIAGAVLGVDPFDEPNVTEAKDTTRAVLEGRAREEGASRGVMTGEAVAGADRIVVRADAARRKSLAAVIAEKRHSAADPASWIGAHLASAGAGDYVAILAYMHKTPARDAALQAARVAIRDRHHVATTLGYGPRFLHSTGQLHKGGPANGVFLIVTTEEGEELPIPGEEFGFGALRDAQALGDHLVLARKGRRALRVHLVGDADTGVRLLRGTIEDALRGA